MNEYVRQIYELIDKKTEELLQQEKQDDSSFMARYDYVRSRITMFLLDYHVDFLNKANRGVLGERDVRWVKFLLENLFPSLRELKQTLKWCKEKKEVRRSG